MRPNPYGWQSEQPRQILPRSDRLKEIVEYVRRGAAVKIVGGRGMGKSMLLHQLKRSLEADPETRVVLVPGPPEEMSGPGAVRDLAARLGIRDLALARMDDLLERVLQGNVMRLIALFDETDQYVIFKSADADAAFARTWFNKLETTRKQYGGKFDVVFAGGLGLLYLEREVGSGIVSRAEPCVLAPFSAEEIENLARPFEEDGRPLDSTCLEALRMLSGGIPALVAYGLEKLWGEAAPSVQLLEGIFGRFRERHDSFVRAVHGSVSRRGTLEAPWRVLEAVRDHAGAVPMEHLRHACAPEPQGVMIDVKQALDLLCAAGLVRVEGSMVADPLLAWPVASILNMPETPAGTGDPIDRLVQDVSAILASLHRFGRDFHDGGGLLHEDVFSSIIAVGLRVLGWSETDREAIQAAGCTDVKVRLFTHPGIDGHVIIETKLWRTKSHNEDIQKQVADYRVASTRHGIAVTLGVRDPVGWKDDYEKTCLDGLSYEARPIPTDLVGSWRVKQLSEAGEERLTDHLLVQIPKRR